MSSINEKSHTENMDIMFSYIPDAVGQESIPLLDERLVFAIHKDHPAAAPLKKFAVSYEQIISKNIPFQNEVEDTTIFENVPFIETGRLSDVDSRLNQIVKLHKVSPYVVAHSSNYEIRYRLMQEKLGAVFITDLFLSTLPQISRDIYFIPLNSPLSFRTLYIRYHKNRKANEHLHKFITNIFEYCKTDPKLCDYCGKYIAEYENNHKHSL